MNVERLNAERKRDLAAHYEKEKRLLGTRPAAGGDAAAKPRKPSSVKFTDAYSRDPNKLFVQVRIRRKEGRAHAPQRPAAPRSAAPVRPGPHCSCPPHPPALCLGVRVSSGAAPPDARTHRKRTPGSTSPCRHR